MNGKEDNNLTGRFAVYVTKKGAPAVVARFEDDDVWLTQKQLAELFKTSKQLVSHHIRQILESGELERNRTVKKYLTVQSEGGREIGRHVEHYNRADITREFFATVQNKMHYAVHEHTAATWHKIRQIFFMCQWRISCGSSVPPLRGVGNEIAVFLR